MASNQKGAFTIPSVSSWPKGTFGLDRPGGAVSLLEITDALDLIHRYKV